MEDARRASGAGGLHVRGVHHDSIRRENWEWSGEDYEKVVTLCCQSAGWLQVEVMRALLRSTSLQLTPRPLLELPRKHRHTGGASSSQQCQGSSPRPACCESCSPCARRSRLPLLFKPSVARHPLGELSIFLYQFSLKQLPSCRPELASGDLRRGPRSRIYRAPLAPASADPNTRGPSLVSVHQRSRLSRPPFLSPPERRTSKSPP